VAQAQRPDLRQPTRHADEGVVRRHGVAPAVAPAQRVDAEDLAERAARVLGVVVAVGPLGRVPAVADPDVELAVVRARDRGCRVEEDRVGAVA
jgi:hypothetical protein